MIPGRQREGSVRDMQRSSRNEADEAQADSSSPAAIMALASRLHLEKQRKRRPAQRLAKLLQTGAHT